MELLIRQRGVVKGKLTSFSKFLNNLQPGADSETVPLSMVKLRSEKLEEVWDEFNLVQEKIQMTCAEDQLEAQQIEREEFDNKYFHVKCGLDEWIAAAQPNVPPTEPAVRQSLPTQVRLPKLDLPTFSGSYTEWVGFYDLFRVLVHDNNSLGDVQKLQYLKGCLRGTASRLIQALEVTDANYVEAWKLLRERYDNKRQIIAAHFKALFSQPALQKDSATGLRQLLDVFLENMRSVSVLKADEWDYIMVYLFTERMDSESRRLWEMSITTVEPSTFNELKAFVQQRCQALEVTTVEKDKQQQTTGRSLGYVRTKPTTNSFLVATSAMCVLCNSSHFVQHCDRFIKATPEERVALTKQHRLCFNCLREGHSSTMCKSGDCRKCGKRHHTLLHFNKRVITTTPRSEETGATNKSTPFSSTLVVNHFTNNTTQPQVLLSTVMVNIQDLNNDFHPCRALLDSGSQGNFVTERLIQLLKLKRTHERVSVSGIGATGITQSCGIVNLHLSSSSSNFELNITAIILPKITGDLPSKTVNPSEWSHFNNLRLADPNYHTPGRVDLLLGADVFTRAIGYGKILGDLGQPSAHNTEFGWIISGKCGDSVCESSITSHLVVTQCTVANQLKKFWELEEVKTSPSFSLEEKQCELHFSTTTVRSETGRYIVELPFREDVNQLGESRMQALSRLKSMERKLDQQPQRKQQYVEFMQDYLNRDHMELVPETDIHKPDSHLYYLPHHCVYKESSSTTKLRVVFDASAPTTKGPSLNGRLMVGPTLQGDLISILLRFRTHRVAFTADIAKMFRQIQVHPGHQDFQRILWRNTPEEPIQTYRLKTVTYGTASAPYLAVKTLHQVASDEACNFPKAARVITQDFYVDDCMTGADSFQKARELQQELISLLRSGGFELHKWASNSSEVLADIPEEKLEVTLPLDVLLGDCEETVKTLGILWHPTSDNFSFHVPLSQVTHVSKRSILSEIASLFDPFGWISPVVISAKILLQKIWLTGLSWDAALPEDIVQRWLELKMQLPVLNQLKIPRYLGTSREVTQTLQLHGFCDASEEAYGAVIYLRLLQGSAPVSIKMLCSKTRVAPLKKISIPRLELCAAVLLVRLMDFIRSSLHLEIETVFAWSDSTVVLAWIRGNPNRWKTFVANRVSEIHDIIPPEHWFHVGTKENPADCASRGVRPQELLNNNLWWNGPSWLLTFRNENPSLSSGQDDTTSVLEEQRAPPVVKGLVATTGNSELLFRYSALPRLVRVTALLQRFSYNCKVSPEQRRIGFITSQELEKALLVWVKRAQSEGFSREFTCLTKREPLPADSQVKSLCPFLDNSGLLRVGGRLENSGIHYNQRHPLLLPQKHVLTELLITHEHLRQLHGGPALLLSILRRTFWIVNARNSIRQIIHKCVPCFRQRATGGQQIMGQLPSHRVNQARPFIHTGVDYAGPLTIRATTGRGRIRTEKCYIALFICFSTKAIHLELVTSLSTEAFIAAFRRFVARRGRCCDVYSDCGTNFVGANRELKELASFVKREKHNQDIGTFLASEGITWHFNPPASPHFGGLWEAGVKSTKFHLRRIVGNNTLTFEQLYTVLTQVEACLNSRPLCQLSSDPSDLSALTPGHFLIGDSLVGVPDPDLSHLKISTLSKWQLLQRMLQDFWKRWSSEYLSALQQRPKWMHKQANFNVGDLVLVKEEDLPPLKWKLARVTATHPGIDGLVRTVTIKTAVGFLRRPIVKLCRLPLD